MCIISIMFTTHISFYENQSLKSVKSTKNVHENTKALPVTFVTVKSTKNVHENTKALPVTFVNHQVKGYMYLKQLLPALLGTFTLLKFSPWRKCRVEIIKYVTF